MGSTKKIKVPKVKLGSIFYEALAEEGIKDVNDAKRIARNMS